jgi:hypothetical protein
VDGSVAAVMRVPTAALLLAFGPAACGVVPSPVLVQAASSRIEEARAIGAERLATYEYYCAKEHLDRARSVVSDTSSRDAARLAQEAQQYASEAIELTEAARSARP